jgi:molybdenum cofactor guanylyltransferase
MGRDKASIEIEGIPLIRRIYEVVAACRAPASSPDEDRADLLSHSIYVQTPWAQRYQPILPASCQFISEPQLHQGPLVAFERGLRAMTSDWVLLVACDLPNLSTPLVQSWIDRLPSIPAQSIAYLPKHPHKGWEPLCGFYRQICQRSLDEYIHAGGKSFQGWLAQNPVTELEIADRTCLMNCNTPADLAAIAEYPSHIDLK